MIRPSLVLATVLLSLAPAGAADLAGAPAPAAAPPGYGYGLEAWRQNRHAVTCPLWQPPYGVRIVPTNDRCDPTYVGSSMGLSRPSYYGTLPPPGYDAP
jgi:hypothetical protein